VKDDEHTEALGIELKRRRSGSFRWYCVCSAKLGFSFRFDEPLLFFL